MNKLLMEQYETNLLFESTNFKFIEDHATQLKVKIYFNKVGDTGDFDNHIEYRLSSRSNALSVEEFVSKVKSFIDLLFYTDSSIISDPNKTETIELHKKLNTDKSALVHLHFMGSKIKVPVKIEKHNDFIKFKIITVLTYNMKTDNPKELKHIPDSIIKLSESSVKHIHAFYLP